MKEYVVAIRSRVGIRAEVKYEKNYSLQLLYNDENFYTLSNLWIKHEDRYESRIE